MEARPFRALSDNGEDKVTNYKKYMMQGLKISLIGQCPIFTGHSCDEISNVEVYTLKRTIVDCTVTFVLPDYSNYIILFFLK